MSDGKGIYYTVAAIGGVMIWSGIRGYSILKAAQNIIQGKNPNDGQVNDFPVGGSSSNSGGSGSSGGAGPTPTSGSERAVYVALLAYMKCPPSTANIHSLTAWRTKESPWNNSPPDGAQYTHNPLNTTENGPGVIGEVNSVGVKRYDNWADGIKNTGDTITNGSYPQILSRLRSGQGLCGFTSQEFVTWSGAYSSVC